MRRDTANVLLLIFAAAVAKIAITDAHLRFVKASLQPYLLVSAIIIGVLAALSLGRDLRRTGADLRGGHEHGGRSLWLLVLPVLALVLVLPEPLGADKVRRSVDTTPPQRSAFAPLPPGVPDLTLTEFVVRAVWDETGTLQDRPVRLTGFVVRDGDDVLLARLAIGCCAADAQPKAVRLSSHVDDVTDAIDELPQDSWWQVTAELEPDQEPSSRPTVDVTTLHPVKAPASPYES